MSPSGQTRRGAPIMRLSRARGKAAPDQPLPRPLSAAERGVALPPTQRSSFPLPAAGRGAGGLGWSPPRGHPAPGSCTIAARTRPALRTREGIVTEEDLRQQRLRNLGLSDAPYATPAAVVAALGAVQAQDYGGA